ncbi:MAG: cob(I)yrinic acid a,c-diamide adenosyltransferase [Gammaproteobacteria bacterium]|jgi:cob(I)alamin adenosyltransferase|nr:cob(I)yrinic acid a,c-diamide adenosyltransferase [Gammaproteobacteria bacterium]
MKKPASPQQHQQRMAKIKQKMDQKIASADKQQGIILVLTGNGKGKSSSAFGMLARSLGYGHQCSVIQFIKGAWECGEELFFAEHPKVDYHALGAGFTWETQNREADQLAANNAWAMAKERLQNPDFNLVILDEMTYMFNQELLHLDEVIATLQQRPARQNVIITGRAAPEALLEAADTVSEVKDIKHAFRQGIKAQPGIEY